MLALLTATISSCLAFHRLGANSLFGDETIFASIARDVVVSERWYPLYNNGVRYVSKPPLSIWPMALRFKAAGVSEVNARIGSALGGVLVSMLLFALGVWLVDAYTGALAALLLITAPPWLLEHGVREGVGDIWTAMFTGIALLAYVQGRIAGSRRLLAAAILAAVAGSLIKGPVVFLVFVCVSLLWEALARWLHGRRPRGLLPCGIALLSAIPFAIWIADNAARDGPIRTRIWGQFFGRHTRAIDPTHLQDALFYPRVVMSAFGWWLLVLAVPLLWRWLRGRELALLLPVWAFLPIVVFSLSVSKLPWYLDPVLPPLAMLIAIAICLGIARVRSARLRYVLGAVVAGALAMRIGAAWNAINAAPRRIDMHRIAIAYQSADRPALYADTLDTGPFGFREWNRFYLDALPKAAPAVPARLDPSRCSVVVTLRPHPLMRRADFDGAAIRQLRKHDPREADLYLIDRCGGHFTEALRGN